MYMMCVCMCVIESRIIIFLYKLLCLVKQKDATVEVNE